MTPHTISVIIPCYNCSLTIEACVAAAIESSHPPLEVILVDDASTDSTPGLIANLVSTYPGLVRSVRHKVNEGPAKARNTGAEIARGNLFFFLDSDTCIEPHTLSAFVADINDGNDVVVGIYHFNPLNDLPVAHYKALLNFYLFSRHGKFPYEVFNGAVSGLKAEVFCESGGYNPEIKWGMDYENEEYGHRLYANYRMICDPAILARHHFQDFTHLTRTYFIRVRNWMSLFLVRRNFEQGGTASAGVGLSTLAAIPLVGLLPLSFSFQPAAYAALALLAFYLYGYGGFFAFVARTKPLFLPLAAVLNLWFSSIITLAACFGVINHFFRRT